MQSRVHKITQVGLERVEKKSKAIIESRDENKEPDLQLRRVKWVEYLESYDRTQLLTSIEPINVIKEAVLQGVQESFEQVFYAAQDTVIFGDVGRVVLFEVNRKEQGIKLRKLFDSVIEDRTVKKYKEVWRQIICYIFRTQEWPEEERPAYRFTEE